MGSLLSTVQKKGLHSTERSEKTKALDTDEMASSNPPSFSHFANAQETFPKTLPLIANENAYLADIVSSESLSPETPISAGFYRLDPGTPLEYTYTYDECKIIVDGDFEISDETGKTVKAVKGDVFFFPKGSKILFKTEKGGLGFFCGQRKKDSA